ncbi:Ni/Fe-hydrogenase 1 b-type cytochrome subunit [Marinicaulis flavus]|uniref:Ni/Fe-hydrogenase 1 b-type cytochrome subunit n=2 Tax=Hyphococcus luteus TaxID=2058213 RepID=A0A2S7K3Y6_9PROT|nr:Ni/Fe-hydrogenase 1 b-type cytochrome subunit [Marinicaulis flavus]
MTETVKTARAPLKDAVIWDWSLRVFHWSAVLLIVLLWWSAENGIMDWHRRFGLTMLGLLVFRLYWGVAGTKTARFKSFVKGPKAVRAYLREMKRPYVPAAGHNPLGALSVVALLLVLVLQVGAGLFAVDVDGLESGPLSRFVSFEAGRAAAEFHETSFNILLALIVLHVAAIAFYFAVLKTNLVRAMVTGKRAGAESAGPFPLARFLIGVVIAGAAVALVQL